MKPAIKITAAGNVVIPAFLALKQRGYSVQRRQRSHGAHSWIARTSTTELVSDDPVTLLALAALAQTRGEQWKASDDEIQQFLDEYGPT